MAVAEATEMEVAEGLCDKAIDRKYCAVFNGCCEKCFNTVKQFLRF